MCFGVVYCKADGGFIVLNKKKKFLLSENKIADYQLLEEHIVTACCFIFDRDLTQQLRQKEFVISAGTV